MVVVTGGGRGLGLGVTREFLRRGARVAICGRDGGVIERAERTLRAAGGDVWGAACDVSDPVQVSAFLDAVRERFGPINALVNNAGQCFVGPAAELEAADMEYALRHIFWVVYHPTMAALPQMRDRRSAGS